MTPGAPKKSMKAMMMQGMRVGLVTTLWLAAQAGYALDAVENDLELREPQSWELDAVELIGIKLNRSLVQQATAIVPCEGERGSEVSPFFGIRKWALAKDFSQFCYYPSNDLESPTQFHLLNGPAFSFPYEALVNVAPETGSVISVKIVVPSGNYPELRDSVLHRFGKPTNVGKIVRQVIAATERFNMVERTATSFAWSGQKGLLLLTDVAVKEDQASLVLVAQDSLTGVIDVLNKAEAVRENAALF